MSEIQNDRKILEVKIRSLPNQERQDQRDVSRVFISKDALLDLRLEAGQLCYLWKLEDVGARRRQAIAWPAAQKLNKNVIQMFKTFQDVCGFKLEDKIALAPAEDIQSAECVILKDITGIDGLKKGDLPHWEWYLEDKLGRQTVHVASFTFLYNLQCQLLLAQDMKCAMYQTITLDILSFLFYCGLSYYG
jgi:AAA family ATPase